MKYDLAAQILTNEEDKPIDTSDTDKTPFNAQRAIARGLLNDTTNNASSKTERFDLYLKVRASTADTDFSAPEVALMREVALTYPTLFAGQLVRILDQR